MRFCLLSGIVVAVLAVFPSAPVRAEKHPGEAGKEEKHSPEAGKTADGGGHGERPDDAFAGWLDLTIWTIVVFLVLVGVLHRFAWKDIREGLDKRETDIARDKEEAKTAREEAAQQRAHLQTEMTRAQEQVRGMLDKARHDAETLAAERDARSKAEIQTERERLNREVQTARDQALQEIWQQAAVLSSLVASKVLERQLTGDDHRRLIDEALNELKASAEERKREFLSVRA
jgi:F-type H+-transporting ATPase subunit b